MINYRLAWLLANADADERELAIQRHRLAATRPAPGREPARLTRLVRRAFGVRPRPVSPSATTPCNVCGVAA
ncbi:MAG TPA: hypothetical protein VIV06_05335 [Candidatus Limnocylindrales bacterium]